LKVPSRNNTEDRLRKNTQNNGFSNRVSPATNARQQKENDKKMERQKMKEQTAVHSRITPALVAFFVPHFFVIKSFFLTRRRSQSNGLQQRPKSSGKSNSCTFKGQAFQPDAPVG
jgi:ATP-dependent Zn protease